MENYSIAIDGPAGAGKSTIARIAASKLGFIYVDTGAMYRAFALHCLENNIDVADVNEISKEIDNIDINIIYENKEQQVILNNRNVTLYIRTNQVSQMTSAVSVHQPVREKMVELQRKIAQNSNVVMDGRDIGTFVLPNATLKIYLTASVEIRAKRRYLEMKEKNVFVDLDNIKEEIKQRDERDMNREFAPLSKADDAVLLDSTDMTIDKVAETIVNLYKAKI